MTTLQELAKVPGKNDARDERKTIWLINPYGPISGESWRDYRFELMGKSLAAAGYEVIWWTSNFSHHRKSFRSEGWKDLSICDHFSIRLVPTTSYRRNIGPGRIIRDWAFAARMYWRGKSGPSPDCILHYESPLCFGFAGIMLGRKLRVPVIFDQVDEWPELFVKAAHPAIRPFLQAALWPVFAARRWHYRQLAAAIGLARDYLGILLKEAPVLKDRPNVVIYNGNEISTLRKPAESSALPSSIQKKAPGEIWTIFAGSLGPSYDIQTILSAAALASERCPHLRFFIAGDGPLRGQVESAVRNQNFSVTYLGPLSVDSLAAAYQRCDIGLCAYSGWSNVQMPDKIYDYTAAGLPILISLRGESAELTRERKFGLEYHAGDPQDMLCKLLLLAEDQPLRNEMARNSLAFGREFEWGAQQAKLIRIVDEVCRVHRPAKKPSPASGASHG